MTLTTDALIERHRRVMAAFRALNEQESRTNAALAGILRQYRQRAVAAPTPPPSRGPIGRGPRG